MDRYQKNPMALKEPRRNRSAFYFFVKAERHELESEMGQNLSVNLIIFIFYCCINLLIIILISILIVNNLLES